MKKMVYLEEHGYILSPDDIVIKLISTSSLATVTFDLKVWAGVNQFSSYEKANEIFHHLVNEKGLSVNAIRKEVIHDALLFATCAIFVIVWVDSSASCLREWKHFWSEMAWGTRR